MHKALVLTVNPVVLADILLQPPRCKLLFLFGEPAGSPWEVRQDKASSDSNDNGNGALDDEEPSPEEQTKQLVRSALTVEWQADSPCTKTSGIIHVACNACRHEAGKCTGYQRTRVQQGGSEAKLFASVPRTQEVQTTGLLYRLVC